MILSWNFYLFYAGDFGTVIVHPEVGVTIDDIQTPMSSTKESLPGQIDVRSSLQDMGAKDINFTYVAAYYFGQVFITSV